MDILKEAGIVSKLFDYDFSGEELFEKCKNASEPLRYLLLALETEPTNKKYYEYAISNYGDSDGNLYALAAMNGINIFSSINQIIEDGISGSREDFEKIIVEKGGVHSDWYSIARAMTKIKAKVLWFHDEDDDVTPLSDAIQVKEANYPNVEFVITKGLGHRRIYRDNEVVKAIVDFL